MISKGLGQREIQEDGGIISGHLHLNDALILRVLKVNVPKWIPVINYISN